MLEKVKMDSRPFLRPYEVKAADNLVKVDGDVYSKDSDDFGTKLYVPVTITKIPTKKQYQDNTKLEDIEKRVDNIKRTWVANSTSRNFLIEKLGSDEKKWIGKNIELVVVPKTIKKDNKETQVDVIYAKGSEE